MSPLTAAMLPRMLTAAAVGLPAGSFPQASPARFPPFTWPDNCTAGDDPARDKCSQLPRSKAFSQVEFTGRYATYGAADTWYPTWAADGNLYTPWTDGTVNGVGAGSSCAQPGCMSTTGFATVIGEDPLDLTVTQVGAHASSPGPYHGRYPCGSFVKDGIWFYGTYFLDNENHEPGNSHEHLRGARVSRAGYCQNWCIQAPFAGFRWTNLSTPVAPRPPGVERAWTEPRVVPKGWGDNIFGEQAPDNHTYKVKFGAPHVVDHGRELEYSPDGKVYIVGHGASSAYSPTGWMQGSEVYMARSEPTISAVQDGAQWEFFAGTDPLSGQANWVSGDVSKAKPLLSWGNRTGVTTMTYIAAAKRYIMCVSTPTFSPFLEKQFDTYFLESKTLTGPFFLITYMREFGPEAYFVNIPSKFVAPELDKGGSLTLYLSYSANFAFKKGSQPPGSGYHWTLTEMKFHGAEPEMTIHV